MKKVFICMLAVCMSAGALWAQAFSAVNGAGKTIYYEVENGTALTVKVVASGGEVYSGEMEIPTTVVHDGKTYTVVEIGKEAFNGSGITSVSMGSGVTTIGVSAFRDCWALTEVALPNTLTTIERYAFMDCGSLESITLPRSLTSLGKEAFAKVVNLKTVYWNAENMSRYSNYGEDYHPFKKSPVRKVVFGDGVQTIPSKAFHNFATLDSVIVGSAVVSIGDKAFAQCGNMGYLNVRAMTPPTINASVFEGVGKSIDVYVPCEALSNYRNHAQWRYFTNIQCESGVGIEGVDMETVKVYPNPTTGLVHIDGAMAERVEVWSISGMKVAEYKGNMDVNMSTLGNGIYLMRIITEEGVIVRKVVKK